MSFVGPRPEVPKYVALYDAEQKEVLKVKPGITDYASIVYSEENELLANTENPEELYIKRIMPAKLKLNMRYIHEMSLATDVKVILRTIRKIFQALARDFFTNALNKRYKGNEPANIPRPTIASVVLAINILAQTKSKTIINTIGIAGNNLIR